jgi:hypothetical protein
MPSSGPTYRIEDGATIAQPLDWSSTQLMATRNGPYATFHANGKSRCARLEPDGVDEIDLGAGDLLGSAVINGQLWLATSHGALRISGREAVRVGPDRAVSSIQSLGDTLWFLGDDCIVRVDSHRETLYPTGDLKATRVVRAGENDWVLTSKPGGLGRDAAHGGGVAWWFAADDGTSDATAALLVDGDQLIRVDGGGSGVRNVVQLADETWLLTSIAGRVGPARRWHR